VLPEFETQPSRWAKYSKIYFRDASANGVVTQLSGDGGILFSRRVATLIQSPWYNVAFAMTGGADSDLFLRLQNKGARFARAKASIIREFYPESRQSLAWALKRAYRIGNTRILIDLQKLAKVRLAFQQAPKIGLALFGGPVLAALCFWSPGLAVDMLCKSASACGKITGLLGSKYMEYERVHGN
jgi:succinoglycan biosynthesis protein ExoM